MIILEGPDGSGKTTLLNQLSARYPDWVSRHSGGPIRGYKDFRSRTTELMDSPRELILDRCMFISEEVYGPLFGRQLPDFFQKAKHDFFEKHNPLVIWCFSPSDEMVGVQENPAFDTPDYVDKLKALHPQIVQRYHEAAANDPIYSWSEPELTILRCDVHVFGTPPLILPHLVSAESFTTDTSPSRAFTCDPVMILRYMASATHQLKERASLEWAIEQLRKGYQS